MGRLRLLAQGRLILDHAAGDDIPVWQRAEPIGRKRDGTDLHVGDFFTDAIVIDRVIQRNARHFLQKHLLKLMIEIGPRGLIVGGVPAPTLR